MLGYRLSTVNDFHWGLKLVWSYGKDHIQKCIYSLYPDPLEYETYDRKVEGSLSKKGTLSTNVIKAFILLFVI